MTTGELVLRVIQDIEVFRCTRLRCWITPKNCARRHHLAKRMKDEVEVNAPLHGVVMVANDECRQCHIGAAHIAQHHDQKKKTARPMKKRQKDRSTRIGTRSAEVGETIGIFTVLSVEGQRAYLECGRCKSRRWKALKRPTLERAPTCQACPVEIRRQAHGITQENIREKAISLIKQGQAITTVAKLIRTNRHTVKLWLLEEGIKTAVHSGPRSLMT